MPSSDDESDGEKELPATVIANTTSPIAL